MKNKIYNGKCHVNFTRRRYVNNGIILGILCILSLMTSQGYALPQVTTSKKTKNGETQVIANVDGREVTLNELRLEVDRLGLDLNNPDAERIAMQSLADRILIVKAAKDGKLHKRPEALWRMESAKDRALAEFYMAIIAQPSEPTQRDVENFMLENPTLFGEAKRYTFSVLELPRNAFDVKEMTPLFDETSSFGALKNFLDTKNIVYTLDQSVRPGSSFPRQIRRQLAAYNVSDNLVLQGPVQTSILKIIKISNESVTLSEGAPAARVLLRKEDSNKRAVRKIEALRSSNKVKYFRENIKPELPEEKKKNQKEDDNKGGIQITQP